MKQPSITITTTLTRYTVLRFGRVAVGLMAIILLLYSPAVAQTVIFDDFNYSNADDPAIESFNKWHIVNDLNSGPPSGADYLKSNVTFTSDGIMELRCSNAGTPASATHSRIETGADVNYLEGTYAARVYFDNAPRNNQDPIIQTFYAISPAAGGANPATYAEVDFEYLPWDAWSGMYGGTYNNAMWMSSYESSNVLPSGEGLDNAHVILKQDLAGWHDLVFRFVDDVNVEYFIDGVKKANVSTRASDGVSVYPDYNMLVSFANWAYPPIDGSTFGPGTQQRSSTMKVDWFVHVKDQSKSPAEVQAIVDEFRSRGVKRRNRQGQEYATTPQPPTGVVTVYKHCDFGGYAVGLPVGSYTLAQLQALGVVDNDISSVKVQSGYQVTFYDNSNVSGTSLVKTADDNCLNDEGFNDVASSVVVGPVVAPPFSILRQAESYTSAAAVSIVTTTDPQGGAQHVTAIDTEDWLAYANITIPESGNYTAEYRVSSVSGGLIALDLNGGAIYLGEVAVPPTGSASTWTTVQHTVYITAGTYAVGLYAGTGGWNINWWKLTRQAAAQPAAAAVEADVVAWEVYPNPVQNSLSLSPGFVGGRVVITDQTGNKVLTSVVSEGALDVSTLRPGVYTVVVTKNKKTVSRKIIKQ